MEFWASEVKSGESFKVQPGKGMVLHLSQANLGKFEKGRGNKSVFLFVNVDGKELVLGTLSSKKLPHQHFDLLFDRDFELSHDWKGGSVYFFGYRATNPVEDQDIPKTIENGEREEEEPTSTESDSDDSTSDDDDSSDKAPPMFEDHSESSDSEDEDDSEEDTHAKVEPGKTSDSKLETPAASKKVKVTTLLETPAASKEVKVTTLLETPAASKEVKVTTLLETPAASKEVKVTTLLETPAASKKVKVTTLQKTVAGGKKGGVALVATPHPLKKVGETSCGKRKHKRRKQ